MKRIMISRVYDDLSEFTGKRVLVDRLWPRGKKKETLKLDLWARDVSPSTPLRKKYDHTSESHPAFREAYRAELDENPLSGEFIARIKDYLAEDPVLFLYAARSTEFNHAKVLKEWVEEKLQK